MPIRYSDLPAAVRARIDAQPAAKGDREPRAEHYPWRCKGCGKVFEQWAPAQRHIAAGCHGRHRLDLLLESERETP